MLAQVTDIKKKSTVSLDTAAGMVAEQVRSTGKPWAECARRFLRAKDSPTLSRSDLIDAAARGLAARAREVDTRNFTADRVEKGHVLLTVADVMDTERPRMLNALSRMLQGADPGPKPFNEFNPRDRAVFIRQQRDRGDGYYRSANFVDKVDGLCVKNKVKIVKDLPVEVQVGLLKEVPW